MLNGHKQRTETSGASTDSLCIAEDAQEFPSRIENRKINFLQLDCIGWYTKNGRLFYIYWGCIYDGVQMQAKWRNSGPSCLFVLARFFSPTTFKWSTRSLRFPARSLQLHSVLLESRGQQITYTIVRIRFCEDFFFLFDKNDTIKPAPKLCNAFEERRLGSRPTSPACFAGDTFKMADEPFLLGIPDGNMEGNNDKICGWSTNKIGGTPVSNRSS